MAAGDLITTDHQYEYCGLLMGSGTQYIVESWVGLFGFGNIRASDIDRLDRHGSVPGLDLMSGKTFQGHLHILDEVSQSEMESLILALQTVMRPKQIEQPFVYKRPGQPKKYMNCRPRKSDMPTSYEMAHGHSDATLEFYAATPVHYALAQSTLSATIASGQTSVQFQSAANNGNWPTDPVITIQGPATNVRLTVSGQTSMDGVDNNNRTIGIDVVLGSTDVLTIDVGKRTIKLNGVSRYDLKRTDNKWWSLFPGGNTVVYQRVSNTGAGSTCTMTWHDAWAH